MVEDLKVFGSPKNVYPEETAKDGSRGRQQNINHRATRIKSATTQLLRAGTF